MSHDRSPLPLAILALIGIVAFIIAWTFAFEAGAKGCTQETDEQRIIEKIAPNDTVKIIEGADLDLFIANADDLYNIGWVRKEIARIYSIDAEIKSDNPKFQPVHLFFINNDHCIAYYQTAYKAVIELLLSPKPCEVLGIACAQ